MEQQKKQELHWMPIHPDGRGRGQIPIVGFGPDFVWTLGRHRNEAEKPTLPFVPSHGYNAFLEDPIHDYVSRHGVFHYHSRIIDLTKSGVWLLFEYKNRAPDYYFAKRSLVELHIEKLLRPKKVK